MSHLKHSGLSKSGTDTTSLLHIVAGKVVVKIREKLGVDNLKANVWPFREQGFEHLACDVKNGVDIYSITICAAGKTSIQPVREKSLELELFDMAEALHFAGIVTTALSSSIELGSQANEVNQELLSEPLGEGKTNGKLDLWPVSGIARYPNKMVVKTGAGRSQD